MNLPKENYLHFLWKTKRLPWHLLQLTDGRSFHVVESGTYNALENGPDFLNAQVVIEELKWYGHIEMHVKASDWYKHGHQHDPNYNNVILHVVYENDQTVLVNNETLPTIELKNFVDKEHQQRFQEFQQIDKTFPCEKQLPKLPKEYILNMMDRVSQLRLRRKAENFSDSAIPPLLQFVANAFGKNTQQAFYRQLLDQIFPKLSAVAFSPTLFLNEVFEIAQDLIYSQPGLFKTRGNRNQATEERVEQFALLCRELVGLPFVSNAHQFIAILKSCNIINKNFQTHLLINSFAVFLYYMEQENHYPLGTAEKLWKSLPPENNRITRFWKEFGIIPENAYQSQSLLEIYQQFCQNKQCLSCSVGLKIMSA